MKTDQKPPGGGHQFRRAAPSALRSAPSTSSFSRPDKIEQNRTIFIFVRFRSRRTNGLLRQALKSFDFDHPCSRRGNESHLEKPGAAPVRDTGTTRALELGVWTAPKNCAIPVPVLGSPPKYKT